VQGFVLTNLMKDLGGAASSYQAALHINPNESLAWLLTGTLNAFMGNGADALEASERALRLSPLDPLRYFYDSLAASAAITAGKYDRAIELAKRSLKANRTHTSTYRALAIAQSLSEQMDDARETVQKLLQLEPSFTVTQFLARTPAKGAWHRGWPRPCCAPACRPEKQDTSTRRRPMSTLGGWGDGGWGGGMGRLGGWGVGRLGPGRPGRPGTRHGLLAEAMTQNRAALVGPFTGATLPIKLPLPLDEADRLGEWDIEQRLQACSVELLSGLTFAVKGTR
jgi:tetratricopeptide (TPR) repeat protein